MSLLVLELSFWNPQAAGAGATADFKSDGKYELISSGKKKGARVGDYLVAIVGGESYGDEIEDPKAKSILPKKYSSSATSKLTLKVEPGAQEKDFDLKP